ncbi:MAG: peptide deformylase [Gemmatimonadaceae bacterium]|nr:peptide deformylase [Gemmatimonadaceae bacterium]MCW5825839.1 peptide deformylase [Gemmatimonadaceae bacterium]
MAVLPITVLGSPVLREVTTPVTEVTDELRRLAADMLETMRAADGVGLAAPQVGRSERLCVVEVGEVTAVLFNPEIIAREGKIKWEEGCLSIPDVFGWVERSAYVKVRALGLDGQPFELEGRELLAVCIQHELDHLDGKLFLDHLSFLNRRRAMSAWDEEKVKYPKLVRVLPAKAPGRKTEDERSAAAGAEHHDAL